MQHSLLFTLGLAISRAVCAPTSTSDASHADFTELAKAAPAWDEGAVHDFLIHESCNHSEVAQLRKGLADAVTLADHARHHMLRYGNSSAHFRKYFGNGPAGQVLGWYDKVVNGDKGRALFRCDNPDGNCGQPKWAGHWRGENGSDETVICQLSYQTRLPLEKLCALGWTVAEGAENAYWGPDLLHRLYHMPAFSDDFVEHFTEDYAEVLAIGKDNVTYAIRDSDTLQYFALDVYAYDIILPGVGCPGGS